jgi:hypothetical protein
MVAWQPKTNDSQAKSTTPSSIGTGGPVVLIDEDFHDAAEKKHSLPDGWDGDGFTIVTEKDRHGLQVSRKTGVMVAKVRLRQPIKGNFVIEGNYLQPPNIETAVGFVLEDSKSSAVLPILFPWSGEVVIAKEANKRHPAYILGAPTQFAIQREGKTVRVLLDGNNVAEKGFSEVPTFDTLNLSLTAWNATLYRLKVTTLP